MSSRLFDRIDELPDEQSRAEIISFLQEQLPALSSDLERSIEAAYSIAGLMATNYSRNLKDDDPIDEILIIAGELEVNPKNAEELRKELMVKIEALL